VLQCLEKAIRTCLFIAKAFFVLPISHDIVAELLRLTVIKVSEENLTWCNLNQILSQSWSFVLIKLSIVVVAGYAISFTIMTSKFSEQADLIELLMNASDCEHSLVHIVIRFSEVR
jgi:hypothetical protein